MASIPTRNGGALDGRVSLLRRAASGLPPALGRLGTVELRRRLWHIAPGFLPVGLWFYPHRDPASATMLVFLASVVAGFGLHAWLRYRRIARGEDRQMAGAVLGYTLSIIAPLFLFPAAPELGLTVLAVLAFGDGTATLAGMLWGGAPLPWNRDKTWTGTAAFLLAGIPLAGLAYWGETAFNPESLPPHVSYGTALLLVAPAVFLAAMMESLPLRLDDNIRVGGTTAAVLAVAHFLLVGH